jgi:hypothetical protein
MLVVYNAPPTLHIIIYNYLNLNQPSGFLFITLFITTLSIL